MTISDVNIEYYDEIAGRSRTLRELRVIAFLHIPSSASREAARAWLVSQGPRMSKTVRDVVCNIHLGDQVLEGWRADEKALGWDDRESGNPHLASM